jgi:hypothetical protein
MEWLKPEGRRNVGRSRLSLIENAENDFWELKMKIWRQKVNKKESVFVVKQAEVLTEPSAKV